jgi:hypothetical protein
MPELEKDTRDLYGNNDYDGEPDNGSGLRPMVWKKSRAPYVIGIIIILIIVGSLYYLFEVQHYSVNLLLSGIKNSSASSSNGGSKVNTNAQQASNKTVQSQANLSGSFITKSNAEEAFGSNVLYYAFPNLTIVGENLTSKLESDGFDNVSRGASVAISTAPPSYLIATAFLIESNQSKAIYTFYAKQNAAYPHLSDVNGTKNGVSYEVSTQKYYNESGTAYSIIAWKGNKFAMLSNYVYKAANGTYIFPTMNNNLIISIITSYLQ